MELLKIQVFFFFLFVKVIFKNTIQLTTQLITGNANGYSLN